MKAQPRKLFVGRDVDIRKALVVAKHDVVAGAMLLDQVVLQQERLGLGMGHGHLDRDRVRHQSPGLRCELLDGSEVAGDALLQAARLADVEDASEPIEQPIHTRIVGQGSEKGLRVEFGGLRVHGGAPVQRSSYCTLRLAAEKFGTCTPAAHRRA